MRISESLIEGSMKISESLSGKTMTDEEAINDDRRIPDKYLNAYISDENWIDSIATAAVSKQIADNLFSRKMKEECLKIAHIIQQEVTTGHYFAIVYGDYLPETYKFFEGLGYEVNTKWKNNQNEVHIYWK